MKRVKCIFENRKTGKSTRYVVALPEAVVTVKQFVESALQNYVKCEV